MSKNPAIKLSQTQRSDLTGFATDALKSFEAGLLSNDRAWPDEADEFGFTFFNGLTVIFSREYYEAEGSFTRLIAKILKAKAAHEPTIRIFVQEAAKAHVAAIVKGGDPATLRPQAVSTLIATVLDEVSKVYTHIEPNFLFVPNGHSGTIKLGRVRSMPLEATATATPLSKFPALKLEAEQFGVVKRENGITTVGMVTMAWVVDVPATRENVTEEAKWLIDVAVSLARLSSKHWSVRYPKLGDIELHPTRQIDRTPRVTTDGEKWFLQRNKTPVVYDVSPLVAKDLAKADVQRIAELIFDPSANSLALRVSQGLGWLTRGRQASDRSERLLSFFTALEALLTSNNSSDPVTQTISRHVSVIWSSKIADRVALYNQVKSLYALRSAVVHAGKREVLLHHVNSLQLIAETVFSIVLKNCDLSISQDTFSQSLSDASHGAPWAFYKKARSKKR
ncbi:hypothetical protein ACRQ1B_28785 [Rhizobium panacihumi]|uniref:hypothetical protein n=1 Tax=Rhizobium panacihumi TaxID=2008450 RepID=UPI003D7A12D2